MESREWVRGTYQLNEGSMSLVRLPLLLVGRDPVNVVRLYSCIPLDLLMAAIRDRMFR